jgi:hypothetical protein
MRRRDGGYTARNSGATTEEDAVSSRRWRSLPTVFVFFGLIAVMSLIALAVA